MSAPVWNITFSVSIKSKRAYIMDLSVGVMWGVIGGHTGIKFALCRCWLKQSFLSLVSEP